MSTLLVLRPRDRWEESRRLVEASGHQAICASVVEVEYQEPPGLPALLDDVRQGHFASLVFASVTAVKALSRADRGLIDDVPEGTELVAIGPPTADALKGLGVRKVALPDEYTSEGLLDLLSRGEGGVLMFRSDQGNDVLSGGLLGLREFIEVPMYSLREDRGDSLDRGLRELRSEKVDAVLHTSSLSARLTVARAAELFGPDFRWKAINAAIGPPTRDTLLSLGMPVQVTAERATFPDLLRAVDGLLRQSN